MKKLFALILAMLMLCGCCLAESADYTSMTDEQLHAVVDAARNELARRELVVEGKTLLFEQEGVSAYLTSDFKEDSYQTDKLHYFRAEVVVINDSDKNVRVAIESMSVNGWEINSLGFSAVSAGKKSKDELFFNGIDTDITAIEEIETIEITFRLSDADTYKFFADVTPVTLHLNTAN